MFRNIVLPLLFGFSFILNAQKNSVDSLKKVLKTANHDTLKCRVLLALCELEPDDAIWPLYNSEALKISSANLPNPDPELQEKFNDFKAHALLNVAYLY
ncbi:MAG: hypothetical protein ACXVC7_15615, partial [Bacteroidia bacterium]